MLLSFCQACRDFLALAQAHSKRWQKALQAERDQRVRLEETLEQLAKQHNHLERAFRGAAQANATADSKSKMWSVVLTHFSSNMFHYLIFLLLALVLFIVVSVITFKFLFLLKVFLISSRNATVCFIDGYLFLRCNRARKRRGEWWGWWQWVLWCHGGGSWVYHCSCRPSLPQVSAPLPAVYGALRQHIC